MMPRNLSDVIDAMLVLIPQNESALRADLTRLRSDASYLAPERQREGWARGALTLGAAFGTPTPPTTGWQGEVYRVWMGPVWS